MSTNTTAAMRWIAGFALAAGLSAALLTGSAIASADTANDTNISSAPTSTSGTSLGPVNDGVSGRKLQEEVGVPNSTVKSNVRPTHTTDNIQKLLDVIHGMNPQL